MLHSGNAQTEVNFVGWIAQVVTEREIVADFKKKLEKVGKPR